MTGLILPPEPWTPQQRAAAQTKIDKEARRVAKKLGAKCAVIVAFYEDGMYFHMQDGGQSPMPIEQLYRQLLAAKEAPAQPRDTEIQ